MIMRVAMLLKKRERRAMRTWTKRLRGGFARWKGERGVSERRGRLSEKQRRRQLQLQPRSRGSSCPSW